MWLPWETAFEIAAGLAAALVVVAVVVARTSRRWLQRVRTTLVELLLMFTLYGVWQYVHERVGDRSEGAIENARALYKFEQAIHLPDELSIERLFIDHKPVMQFLNIYYGGAHVTAVGILLVWMFVRHRDRYSRIRTTLAVSIAGCFVVQMIPVAPPRFLPDLGFVDAGLLYHQSVYGSGAGISNQVSAMPSLHVGWAVLVGLAVVAISRSRWRWLALLHPALTTLSVVATANHWWLDGVVAVMILGVAYVVVRAGEYVAGRVRAGVRAVAVDGPADRAGPGLGDAIDAVAVDDDDDVDDVAVPVADVGAVAVPAGVARRAEVEPR
jgi:PAP2 superfamily